MTYMTQETHSTRLSPRGVVVVNVNSDNAPDTIVTSCVSNNIGVLLNAGNGTLTAQNTHPTGSSLFGATVVESIATAKPDIIVANYGSNTINVLLAC
jgi:ABC-type Fe3+-hydroxamate transport system substrate-binding protein